MPEVLANDPTSGPLAVVVQKGTELTTGAGPNANAASEREPDKARSRAVRTEQQSSRPSSVKAAAVGTRDLSGGVTPNDLAAVLVGSGVEISNVTYTGAQVAAGTFSGGGTSIGFDSGVILSSGRVSNVIGPNKDDDTGTSNLTPGDVQLTLLAGQPTLDAAILEFDFVPTTSNLTFEYVFASEEYNEYVGSQFNDVFAFFVNGVNCALVPGTSDPVSVNTINLNKNSNVYRNNDLDDGGGSIDTEMDGLTTVLSCKAKVNAGVTNHMRLAIADSVDRIYDANVFLRAGSFVSATPGTPGPEPGPGTQPRPVAGVLLVRAGGPQAPAVLPEPKAGLTRTGFNAVGLTALAALLIVSGGWAVQFSRAERKSSAGASALT